MKKLLLVCFSTLMLIGCTVDTPETIVEENLIFNNAALDNSNLGDYKGVFTTNNGEYRATVVVNLPTNTYGTSAQKPNATLQFPNGDVLVIEAEQTVSASVNVQSLRFEGNELSFDFSVAQDGTNPEITNVTYKNLSGDILISKNTSFAPVTTFTGAYQCVGCANTSPRTWNVMITGDGSGNQTYATQVAFNGTSYSGIGLQENCAVDATNSNVSFCDSKSGDTGSDVGFMVGPNEVLWTGQMAYSNGTPDCSSLIGTWFFRKNTMFQKSGTFKADNSTPNCFNQITFENFENPSVVYTTSISEFSDFDKDYFTRTDGSINAAFFGVVGGNFFAAQDIDADGEAALQYLNFDDLTVDAFSTIYFDATFAEDDDGANQDWDAADYLRVEYSFDGGTTWTTFGAIEADIPSGFNGTPRIDTDLDGVGDGAEITNEFLPHQFAFSNNGTTNPTASSLVSIRVAISLDAAEEDIAIDNILVRGF